MLHKANDLSDQRPAKDTCSSRRQKVTTCVFVEAMHSPQSQLDRSDRRLKIAEASANPISTVR